MAKIHPTAILGEHVDIGEGTEVGPYAIIEANVKLGRDNRIYPHAFIGSGTRMGDRNVIHPNACIGHLPQDLKFDPKTESFTRIGNGNVFREHSTVHRATKPGGETVIGDNGLFMANSHIAHDCVIGNNVVLVNNAGITGHCVIGDNVIMSGHTGLHQFCRVGRLAMVSALSVTNKDLPPFMIFGGRPAVCQGLNLVGLRRAGVGPEARRALRQAFKILYREAIPVSDALAKIERELTGPEVKELVDFVRASKRGISLGVADVEDSLRVRKKLGLARHGVSDGASEGAGEEDDDVESAG